MLPGFVVACSGTSGTANTSGIYNRSEKIASLPGADVFHDERWTIVSTTENGDRVYWFLAPEVEKVTPAMFRKTIHTRSKNEAEAVIVSECEAPKKTCDDLMKKFKVLSEKYK